MLMLNRDDEPRLMLVAAQGKPECFSVSSEMASPLQTKSGSLIQQQKEETIPLNQKKQDQGAQPPPFSQEYVRMYCEAAGCTPPTPTAWSFYMALSLFRLLAILAGVQARAKQVGFFASCL